MAARSIAAWRKQMAVSAAFLVCSCISTSPAPSSGDLNRLGWYASLAGACWEGTDTQGRVVDQQCYQTQFNRYLRGTIAIGADFQGDSVVGWNSHQAALVMYFWSNGSPRGELQLRYEGETLLFEDRSSPTTRIAWTRVSEDSIRVTPQVLRDGEWVSNSTILYRRAGRAPPHFASEAVEAPAQGLARFGWLAELAGRCWAAEFAHASMGDRQCYAFEYPNTLRVSAAVFTSEQAHRGDSAYAMGEDGLITIYYWSDGGHFGTGTAQWRGPDLVMQTDASTTSRTIWSRTGDGFTVTVEQLDGHNWLPRRVVTYSAQGSR